MPLDPELALAFFLPPLLQLSAYRTDWRAFRSNLRPILLLAVGAVAFTAFCIGLAATWLVPGLPFAAALALGAIVAPPDAVAAGAVLQRLRLPKRIVTVLEGESLINDASALVLYKLAVAAALASGGLGAASGAATFVRAGGRRHRGRLGRSGLATLWVLARLDDVILETTTGFLAAYAAYLAGEAVHVSGVMAVVTAGLLFGRAQHTVFSYAQPAQCQRGLEIRRVHPEQPGLRADRAAAQLHPPPHRRPRGAGAARHRARRWRRR